VRLRPLVASLLVFLLLLLTGCGSEGSSQTAPDNEASSGQGEVQTVTGQGHPSAGGKSAPRATNSVPEGSGASGSKPSSASAPSHEDVQTGAAGFVTKGGDNSIQEFGGEASSSEFEQAAAALHGYLDALALSDWPAACSYMAKPTAASLSQLAASSGGKASCAKLLAGLSGSVPASVRRQSAEVDVRAMRVDGSRGFLLLHGPEDSDQFVPLMLESGQWKVAALAPSALL
jgi:hypothetical protein